MDEQVCHVWLGDAARRRPVHEALLDDVERCRADSFVHPDDRHRFVLGAVLVKLVVAHHTDQAAAAVRVDRHCHTCGRPHGRPQVLGSDVHVSVSHSGPLVVVALTRAGPVGIDIERRGTGRAMPPARHVVTPSEPVAGADDLLTYWCRKESVVKATGDGVAVPPRQVVVSPAEELPRLVRYQGRDLAAFMVDLELGGAYAAALTVLTGDRIKVRIHSAAPLLSPLSN